MVDVVSRDEGEDNNVVERGEERGEGRACTPRGIEGSLLSFER
jgi:hypothetical protein